MKEAYLALAGRIRGELKDLSGVVGRTQAIWDHVGRSQDDYYVDATALNLHSFYGGVERLLELIANVVDRTKPAGASWHQELLHQMAAEIPGVRPAVLAAPTRDRLDRYRGFRHVVRNVYTYNLDPEQVGLLVKQLPATMAVVERDLLAFADFLEALAQADEEPR